MRVHRHIGLVLGLAVASLAAAGLRAQGGAVQNSQTTFPLPSDQQFTNAGRQVLSISPDGRQIVYVANTQLYLYRSAEHQAAPIPGTSIAQGVTNPVFSPDGRSIAFWSAADQTFKRIPVEGGSAVTLFRGTNPFGLVWTSDGRIVAGQGTGGILAASASGGAPEIIVAAQAGELMAAPRILPGGDSVMFTLVRPPDGLDKANIVVHSLRTGERRTLVEGGYDARYLEEGRLVFVRGADVMAVRFDPARLETAGPPTTVLADVQGAGNGSAQFSLSDGGALAYVPLLTGLQLSSVSLDGAVRDIAMLPRSTFAPRVSPDGTQIVFNTQGVDEAVWIHDLTTGARRQLTARSRAPLWTSDGARVAYISGAAPDESLWWQRADGGEPAERLVDSARAPESWSAPNQLLSFITLNAGATLDYDIWTYSFRDGKAAPLIVVPESAQHSSRFSPDGRWIAYVSNETGGHEVFVQPYPLTGSKYKISTNGGLHPMWSPDGRQLYFDNAQRLFAVQVQTEPSFKVSEPAPTTIAGFIAGGVNTRRQYDMMPDGSRFLMLFLRQEIRLLPRWAADVRGRTAR